VRNHSSSLEIKVCRDGVIATITAGGELDLANASHLTQCLLTIAETHPERLVLDLGGLVFVDVAGARALDEVFTLLEAECPAILRRPRPSARKVLRLTELGAD
jgi:stage II sporulation protein AA (anti-sigma F factor antagonist)